MAQLYPLGPKELLALQDKDKAVSTLARIFEDEILDHLDDMDRHGVLVDDQVIEGFRQELLEESSNHSGREQEIFLEAVERAIIRVQGIRQTSH